MLKAFTVYIEKYSLFNPEEQILLAVSGGIDSMVMTDLFLKARFSIGIAHCNFLLRGNESNEDESFVDAFCLEHGLRLHTNRFETTEHAREKGISIQMAARELRYSWFEKIRKSGDYSYVSLAHNLDDVIETCFINLSRGTGIRGLSGINRKSGKIIRPLLFASRNEIISHSKDHQIRYREDSSNKSVKYARNRIRHHIIPEFVTINPGFRKNILETITTLSDVDEIYRNTIENIKKEVFTVSDQKILINISRIKGLTPLNTILYELIRPYHFPKQSVSDIIESLDGIAGKQFYSSTHRLIKDRENLIITELPEYERDLYYVEDDVIHISQPIPLSFTQSDIPEELEFPREKRIASIDYDLLDFPLIIRKWKQGDYFQPLGMKNIKKVSDFFIDNKLSIHDKENTWLIVSGNKIVWIIGQRIDDRFKITAKSNRMLIVEA